MGIKTILIVDDSETLRTQLRKDLESGGHKVIEAEDGFDGLNKIGENPSLGLIICDVNMPKMDGLTMCEKLKELKTYSGPIIMMTTESSAEMKARGKAAGVLAWITKPYHAEKLLSVIGKI